LSLKYENEGYKLDAEWDSEQIKAKYNKPSATLIEMRHHAKLLLSAHRFEDTAILNEEILKKEREETEEAARKMEFGYRLANEKLQQAFQLEKKGLIETYETKMRGLIRAEENSLRPLSQRVEKFAKMKVEALRSARRVDTSLGKRKKEKVNLGVGMMRGLRAVGVGERLELPPISLMRENGDGSDSELV
jgi:hypothetical protein